MADNQSAYEERYRAGYGIVHPESHVIRIYNNILRYELGLRGGRFFDYGMGSGGHAKWIQTVGDWAVFGCDISSVAIEEAQKLMPESAENFRVVAPLEDLSEKFGTGFDFIFCNQSLYYLEDADIMKTVGYLARMLKDGGIFYASMICPEHYMYGQSEPISGSNLRRFTPVGRLKYKTSSYMNFKSMDEITSMFTCEFEYWHTGYYDYCIREDEGSTKHNFFLGRKQG